MRKPFRKRVPTIIQLEKTECGAASLTMILHYYGRQIALEKMRIDCSVSRDGANADNIIKAATRHGLDAKLSCLDEKALLGIKKPCIIFWKKSHFMVFEQFSHGFYFVNDPAKGRQRIKASDFKKHFSQFVITLEPNNDFTPLKQPNRVLAILRAMMLKKDRNTILFIVLAAFMLCIPTLTLPILSQLFIDHYLIDNQWDWAVVIIIAMCIFFLLDISLLWLKKIILKRFELYVSTRINVQLIAKILQLPMSFFNQRYNGDLLSRFRSGRNLANIISGKLGNLTLSLIQVILYFAVMLAYNWLLTLITLFFCLLNVAIYYLAKARRYDLNLASKQNNGLLLSATLNTINTMTSIKLAGADDYSFQQWQQKLYNNLKSTQRLRYLNISLTIIPQTLNALAECLLLLCAVYFGIHGVLSVGQIVAFMAIYHLVMQPVMNLVKLGDKIQSLEADIFRINDIYNYKCPPKPSTQHAPTAFKGELTIKDLYFRYNPSASYLLQGINLTVPAGQRIAFVGLSGSGKSTLAKLIASLEHPQKGQIFIDGIDLEQLNCYEASHLIHFVGQHHYLFEATARDNLTFWDQRYDDVTLTNATQKAHIFEMLKKRKHGLDTSVEEAGMNFSGGQRQRLEIARTLVEETKIIILDEATSSLDPALEVAIDQEIRKLAITTILISHRLNTIKDAERIVVFDQGKIIDVGRHNDLISRCEIYKQLITEEAQQ
ncbi:MAG: ATP-binding cassette domain-containing protein [Francisellaceae bacterium]